MNLVEYAKTADPLTQAFIEIFIENSAMLPVLEFEDAVGGGWRYNRRHSLPGVGFRGFNESWTPTKGLINPEFETLVIAGGEIDVDKALVRQFGESRRELEEEGQVRALALRFDQVFIKGDATNNPRVFSGLQQRLTGSQLLAAGSTSGGDALSLATLEKGEDLVDGCTHFISNKTMRRRLSAAARDTNVGGYVRWSRDEFGRRVMEWNDKPFLVLDRDEERNQILPFTESAPGGGTAQCTSIYPVALRPGRGVFGIQSMPPDVEDLGEIDSKPVFRTRMEWDVGVVVPHHEAAARVWGIKDEPFVK